MRTVLIVPYGPASTVSSSAARWAETLHVSGAEASQTFSAVELSGQPVTIGLGDINGDGYEDAVVSVRDRVFNLPIPANPRTFARLAFGSADGLDLNLVMPAVTLELPAPILATTSTTAASSRRPATWTATASTTWPFPSRNPPTRTREACTSSSAAKIGAAKHSRGPTAAWWANISCCRPLCCPLI